VNFIIERDSEKVFKFCSIQSKEGKEILDRLNATGYYHNLSSVVLVENNTHLFVKSTAALRTVALLDYPYPLLYHIFIYVRPAIRYFLSLVEGKDLM
jgi:predicted DCC family thiol-disulfide oxidoreductase YuxK